MLERKKIIAGNWKLNNDLYDAVAFCGTLRSYLEKKEDLLHEKNIIGMICCQAPILQTVKNHLPDGVKVLSQNSSSEVKGAFTGEISAKTIASVGTFGSLVGHSERRNLYNDTDEIVRKKLELILNEGMIAMLCVGESEKIRNDGVQNKFVSNQLDIALKNIKDINLLNIYIAYEPIWAIGTGKVATANDAENMCHFIRNYLEKKYTKELSNRVHILYGGSVKDSNINELCKQNNIDGVLVGGASVKVDDYIKLLENC